jgi:protein phosphatase 1 regulatory subunit 7
MSKDGAAKTEENETKVEQQVGEKTKDDHAKIIEEKQKQIEQQTIFYPHFEQIDLNTFEEDIEQIDLSLSRLKEIESFARFTNLKSICFRSNLLKSFLSPHFQVSNGLSKIQELDFYDNQIEKVENLGQFATTLENLDLSFNRFKKIENLDELVNLRRLYFVHNQIAKIEHLDALTKLEMLELGDNQLRVIENLSALKNLKEL